MPVPTRTYQPLRNWTDFHWRRCVLVATDPRGKVFSMGEAVVTGRPWATYELEQPIRRVILLRPTGLVLRTLALDTMSEAHREVPAIVASFGGQWRIPAVVVAAESAPGNGMHGNMA